MSDISSPATLATADPEFRRQRFENAWRSWRQDQEPPRWQQFLPAVGESCNPEVISLLLHIDIEFRSKSGLPALLAEHYFDHPRLQYEDARLDAERQIELIYWEYQQRWKNGERAQRLHYEAAFPEHIVALRKLNPRLRCPRCRKMIALEETLQTLSCPDCGNEWTTAVADVAQAAPAAGPDELDLRGYALIETLGAGGMGEVHRCCDPALARNLAIKVMKANLRGQPRVEQRFLREARITASLQHPGIVPVHNLGRLADGRLHYTMRLVRGQTFAAILKDEAGKPERLPHLLSIFEKICQAMAYAHSKRIIHRDLKPSNIMAGRFGEVQVMDWGLAKLLSSGERGCVSAPSEEQEAGTRIHTKDADSPLDLSRTGAGFGTPAYMPPEQALGEWDTVDERADVFALGSILCEILTGEPAYGQADVEEVCRRAERGDVAEALQHLQQCGADAALTALCCECLSRQQEDRPRDADVVAKRVAEYQAEVQERLRKAEVERARAESRAREERKRRRLAMGLAVSLLTLVFGLTVAARLLSRAWRNEREAKHDVEVERDRAIAARTRTREALNAMTSEVTGEGLSTQRELSVEQRRFLESVLSYYQEFAAEPGEDRASLERLADAYHRLGLIYHRLCRYAEGKPVFQRNIDLNDQLASDYPDHWDYRVNQNAGRNNLGILCENLGDWTGAETQYRAAKEANERLASDYPAEPKIRANLAGASQNLGNLYRRLAKEDEAEREFRAALGHWRLLATDHPESIEYRAAHARVRLQLASQSTRRRGLTADVEELFRAALRELDKLAANPASGAHYRVDYAWGRAQLAFALERKGRATQAEAEYRIAIEVCEKLVADYPGVPRYQEHLAANYRGLGIVLKQQNKLSEAESSYRSALRVFERITIDYSGLPECRGLHASVHINLGNLLDELGKQAERETQYRAAVKILERLVKEHPGIRDYRKSLGVVHNNLGNLLNKTDRGTEAEKEYRIAVTIRERLAAENPDAPQHLGNLARSHNNLAGLLKKLGKRQEAQEEYRRALAIQERLMARYPHLLTSALDLGETCTNYGDLFLQQADARGALPWFELAVKTLSLAYQSHPQVVRARKKLYLALRGKAASLSLLKRFGEADKDWDRAAALTDEGERISLALERADRLARDGDQARAVQAAAKVAANAAVTADSLYAVACIHALAATSVQSDPAAVAKYGETAVDLLRQAIAKGYKDRQWMKKDPDLDSIRARGDFQKLLAELDKAAKQTDGEGKG